MPSGKATLQIGKDVASTVRHVEVVLASSAKTPLVSLSSETHDLHTSFKPHAPRIARVSS